MTETPSPSRFDLIDGAVIGLVLVQATLAFCVYRFGPIGPIAVHFDLHGHANGWADRRGLGIGMGVMTVVTLLINLVVRLGSLGKSATVPSGAIATTRALLVAAGALLTALMTALAFAPADEASPQRLPLTIAWLLFVIIGAFVGKAAPNGFLGVRVYWTFHSRLAWDKANRLMGRIMFFGGLIGILAMPFVEQGRDMALMMGWFMVVGLGGGALAIVESWRVWRNDPERIP